MEGQQQLREYYNGLKKAWHNPKDDNTDRSELYKEIQKVKEELNKVGYVKSKQKPPAALAGETPSVKKSTALQVFQNPAKRARTPKEEEEEEEGATTPFHITVYDPASVHENLLRVRPSSKMVNYYVMHEVNMTKEDHDQVKFNGKSVIHQDGKSGYKTFEGVLEEEKAKQLLRASSLFSDAYLL